MMVLDALRRYLRRATVTISRSFRDGDWSCSFTVEPVDVALVKVKDIPFPVEKVATETGRKATPPVLRITTQQGSLFFVYDQRLFRFTDVGFVYVADTYTVRWECAAG